MTREEYVRLRNSDNKELILYATYLELSTLKNKKTIDDIETFITLFSYWPYAQTCLQAVITKLDFEFTIIKLIKNDKAIKFL